MLYYLASDDVDQPAGWLPTCSSAALIHVPASAQQAPGALHHCPVCGQPYTSACLLPPLPPNGTLPKEQVVLLCAACGTYAVGLLSDE